MTDPEETRHAARRRSPGTTQDAASAMRGPDGRLTATYRAALEAYAREIEREGLALSRHRSF